MPSDREINREVIVQPTPSLSMYAGHMLKQRLTRMLSHCQGVRDGVASEPVHQMRVWSRRTRAALELFHICYGGDTLNEMEREIKRVADALGEARDLDVMIENMKALGESLPENQRPGVSSFVESLMQDRTTCQTEVDRAVARLLRFDLAAMLDSIIESPAHPEPVESSLAGSIA